MTCPTSVSGGWQVLRRTDTLLEEVAVARSCLPSRLKSPTATELAYEPAPKLVAAPKLPFPAPSSTDTKDSWAELLFATARSCLPSPLKSPTATELGCEPSTKLVAAPKLPVPVPSSTD